MAVILATREAEIRKIMVQGQLRHLVHETHLSPNNQREMGWKTLLYFVLIKYKAKLILCVCLGKVENFHACLFGPGRHSSIIQILPYS
jgi:hypothetical protein